MTMGFDLYLAEEKRTIPTVNDVNSPHAHALARPPPPTSRLVAVVHNILQAALQACWMAGLAVRLNDVMSALGGQPVVDLEEEDKFRAGDYGYRYLVGVDMACTRPRKGSSRVWYPAVDGERAL